MKTPVSMQQVQAVTEPGVEAAGDLKNKVSHQDQRGGQETKHKEPLNVFPLPPHIPFF